MAAPGEAVKRSGTDIGSVVVSGERRVGPVEAFTEFWQHLPEGWYRDVPVVITVLSPAATPPLRAGGSLPKAGAIHAPRQVSGCPGLPRVSGKQHRGFAVRSGREEGKSPLIGSVVLG